MTPIEAFQKPVPFFRVGLFSPLHMAVEAASVESLQGDHEAEGSRMSASLAQWLDQEWIPQDVHLRMAECAKESYVNSRLSGETDVMSIMMSVSESLESRWSEFSDDSFVSAWDVGNYVADYLTLRAGVETCACSAKVVTPKGFDD